MKSILKTHRIPNIRSNMDMEVVDRMPKKKHERLAWRAKKERI
jgi:hypothetical protein